jgi:hypothetical protein
MPKRSNNRRRGKTRKVSSGLDTTRAVASVKTTLVGRQTLAAISTSATGTINLVTVELDPLSLTGRLAAVAGAFNRWRFKWIKFHFISRLSSDFIGLVTMGVSDDVNTAAPSTRDNVLNFRTSKEVDCWKDMTMIWTPVDPSKWYYLRLEASNSDDRLVRPAVFYLTGDNTAVSFPSAVTTTLSLAPLISTQVGTLDIEYMAVYDGASNDAD